MMPKVAIAAAAVALLLGATASAGYFHWNQYDQFVKFDECGSQGPSYVNRDAVVALTSQKDIYGTAVWTINREKPVLFVCGNLTYVAAKLGFGPPIQSLTDEEHEEFMKSMRESGEEFLSDLFNEFPHLRAEGNQSE
ncbi:MAG: hypothetical protein HC871_06215 [Rhizobiales bacterium]|nr:hypothetical protein [Hyphomicrobiales bacterium]